MRGFVVLFAVVSTAAASSGCSAFPSTLSVETNYTIACIRTSDGSVAAILDVQSGRAYASFTSVFQVILSDGFVAMPTLNSASFGTIDVKQTPEGCIQSVFSNATTLSTLVVETLVCSDLADGVELLQWTANVTGAVGVAIHSFEYPMVAQPLHFEGAAPDTDFFLLGQSDSVLLAVSNTTEYNMQSTYPGDVSVQLVARYDDVAGIAIYTADAGANVKRFSLSSVPSAGYCILSITHVPPEVEGADLRLTYTTAMTTFTGDWHDAADIYKAWAVRQWWTATPLSQRADIPPSLLAGGAGWTPGLQV